MSLKAQITDDMKNAMRAKESERLATIRLVLAEIKRKEVDERIELDDAQVTAIVEKMIKQRKDSITQFEAGGRQDLADIEKAELAILVRLTCRPACRKRKSPPKCKAAVAESGAAGPARHGQGHGHPEAEAGWPRRHDGRIGTGEKGAVRRLSGATSAPALQDGSVSFRWLARNQFVACPAV